MLNPTAAPRILKGGGGEQGIAHSIKTLKFEKGGGA